MLINNYKIGVLLILASALLFTMNTTLVKLLDDYPLYEKIFARNILGLLFIIPIIIKNSKSLRVKKRALPLLIARCTFGLLGLLCSYYSIDYATSYADATLVNKMNPFFVIIFSFLLLKEKISVHQIFAILIAFVGIIIVINPKFNSNILPLIIGLFAAMFAGIAYTSIRSLKDYLSPQVIVFYFALVSSIATFIIMIIVGDYKIPTGIDILMFIGMGVFATAAQLCMTTAYKYAEASKISIYNYASIIFSIISQLLIFGIPIGYLTIIGATLVIIAGLYNYIYVNKLKHSS